MIGGRPTSSAGNTAGVRGYPPYVPKMNNGSQGSIMGSGFAQRDNIPKYQMMGNGKISSSTGTNANKMMMTSRPASSGGAPQQQQPSYLPGSARLVNGNIVTGFGGAGGNNGSAGLSVNPQLMNNSYSVKSSPVGAYSNANYTNGSIITPMGSGSGTSPTFINNTNPLVTSGGSAMCALPPAPPSREGSDTKLPDRKHGESKTGREVDPELIKRVLGEILDRNLGVKWDDIIGLDFAKQTLQETVILPHLRPELFKGIRAPPKGLLLFGPPGNGKTMLAKAIATEFDATFFCISAASLVSKMLGESERLMRALFQAAREHQPAIIFIDEIDSILSVRSAQENDGIQRLKTEFFVQMDGVASDQEDRILVMGATNRPAAIDPAARRRLVKRIYVPLPDKAAREALILKSFEEVPFQMTPDELSRVATRTAGYSGFDIASLCREAALGPIRELGTKIKEVDSEMVRPVGFKDFKQAVRVIRPSVSPESLSYYEAWDKEFGSATTPYSVELDNDDDFDAGEDM